MMYLEIALWTLALFGLFYLVAWLFGRRRR